MAPSNALLNQLIQKVVAEVNRRAKNTETNTPLQIAVAAQTANGPLSLRLDNVTSVYGQINKIKHAWYVPTGGTTSTQLVPASSEHMDASYPLWMDTAPGTPRIRWTSGYQMNIWPAPSTAGTVYVTASVGCFAGNSDQDTIWQGSSDYTPVFLDCVKFELGRISPDDVYYGASAQMDLAMKEQGIGQIVDWINTENGNYVRGLIYQPFTRRIGRTR
jgi:hypothetical protein